MFTLYGRDGWGSVLVETQLALYGLPFRVETVGDLLRAADARQAIVDLNPIAQIPTLLLPDGRVMTESAAITLYLPDIARSDLLVPRPDALERASFLRWLVFLVANVYPTFTYADVPTRFVPEAAADPFLAAVDQHRKTLWRAVEGAVSEPWFLGARFSALDLYLGTMTRWEPGQAWFATETPRLAAIGARARADDRVAAIFARHFPS